jgi:hypothetical protein
MHGQHTGGQPLQRERRPLERTAHLENEAAVGPVKDSAPVAKTPARRAPKPPARLIEAAAALFSPTGRAR